MPLFAFKLQLQSPHSRSHRPLKQHFSRPWIFGWLLQFPIQVCFSSTTCQRRDFFFPISLFNQKGTFLSRGFELWPMTLASESKLASANMNWHAKYLVVSSYSALSRKNVNNIFICVSFESYRPHACAHARTHTQTHTHTTNPLLYAATKVVDHLSRHRILL